VYENFIKLQCSERDRMPSHSDESSQLHEPNGLQLIVASPYRNERYVYFVQSVMSCVLRPLLPEIG